MQTGDFVSIDYTGKVKESEEVFDCTIEKVAKEKNVFNPRVSYKPVNLVVGGDFTIKGLDEALKEMKVGEKKTVPITPDKGFGNRDPKLIKLIPQSAFKDQRMDPTPGAWITVNNVRGRILSANGGRIRVDFNHPLAGKDLEYEVEVKKQITDVSEKVKAIAGFLTGTDMDKIEVKLNGKEADLSIDAEQEPNKETKKKIAEVEIKWVKEIEKVRFVDEFDGKVEEKKEEKKPEEPKKE